ncbi:MAG: caspase family protein [Akkermansiaceae bacterium]
MKTLIINTLLLFCVVCASAQSVHNLGFYSPPQEIQFPNGYDVVDDRGEIIKQLPNERSANVQAYDDSTGIRYYMSDWSYQRYREKGIKPNWIRGRAINSKSATPNVMGPAKWCPLPYWYDGKFYQMDSNKWDSEISGETNLFPFNEALSMKLKAKGVISGPIVQSNINLRWTGDLNSPTSWDDVSAVVSPSGDLLATSYSGYLKIWDVRTRQCVWTIPDAAQFFWISGDRLVTYDHHFKSDIGYLRIYDLRNKKIIDTKEKASFAYYSKSLNKAVFSTAYDEIFVFDFSNDEKIFGDWADKSSSASMFKDGGGLKNDRYFFTGHIWVDLKDCSSSLVKPPNRSFQDVVKSVDSINLPKGMKLLCKLNDDLIVCSLWDHCPVFGEEGIFSGYGLYDSVSKSLAGVFGALAPVNLAAVKERRDKLSKMTQREGAQGNMEYPQLGVFNAGQSGEIVRWRDQEFDFSTLKFRSVVISLSGDQYLPDHAKVGILNPTWESYFEQEFENSKNAKLIYDKPPYSNGDFNYFLENSSPMLLGTPPKKCQVSTAPLNSIPTARMWSSPSGRVVAVRDGHRGWTTVLIDTIDKKVMGQFGQSSGLNLAHQDERRGGQSLFKPLDDRGERVAVAAGNNIYIIDYKHGKILSQEWCPGLYEAACSADGSKIYTSISDGSISCYEYDREGILSKVFQLYTDNLSNWVMATKDGYYMTRGGENLVSVSLRGVAQAFSTDQFSLRLNRPDILLERIGAPDEAITIARKMRAKRLERMEVTEDMLKPEFHLPELDITEEVPLTSSKDTITIPVKARDSLYQLERLKVYINNVPVNGRDGVSLRELATQQLSRDIPIKLASGRNKIQISVVNRAGAESLYANIEVTCTSPLPQPALYCVALGVSSYDNPEFDLRYAAKDARDITATLHSCAGESYREVKSLCLTDKEVTREALVRITDFLSLAGVNDTVIFYVAGHGLLDDDYDYYYGTTDIDFDNPERRGVSFDELDDIMAGVSCLKKSMWIDTCHAGELDEEERTLLAANSGAVASLPRSSGVAIRSVGKRGMSVSAIETATTRSVWYERLQGLFVDLRRGSGTTVLTSSAGAEYAFESSRQKNGLFTYALIEALKGAKAADANKDGSIVMSEVADYVKKRVDELSRGKQTPNVRRVNLEGDFVISVGDE